MLFLTSYIFSSVRSEFLNKIIFCILDITHTPTLYTVPAFLFPFFNEQKHYLEIFTGPTLECQIILLFFAKDEEREMIHCYV